MGLNPIAINPADVPTTDKDKRTKTDAVDSKKIAVSLKNNELSPLYVPSIEDEAVRDVQRQRTSCVRDQTRVKNQIRAYLQKSGIEYPEEFKGKKVWTRAFIDFLQKVEFPSQNMRFVLDSKLRRLEEIQQEIKLINKHLREIFKSEKYAKNFELIKTVPGISSISGIVLLTEFIDINRFKTFDELVSYCGLYPTEHSSGEKTKKGSLCKRRNARINTTLIESSWMAKSCDEALTLRFNQLIKRGV